MKQNHLEEVLPPKQRASLSQNDGVYSKSFFDKETFKKEIHYPLIETNLDGAFGSPAPAESFNPHTASKTDLLRNGILFRRPTLEDAPVLVNAWQQGFKRNWAPTRIVPKLEVQNGRSHHFKGLKATNDFSNNWAGGVLSSVGDWTGVLAYWTVPTVSKPNDPQGLEGGWNSASWIGIDGAGSNDVLQAGIEQRVDANGNATYTAWFEWYCSLFKNILGDTSPVSPAIASWNENLYIAWKGDGNNNLNLMYSADDGETFQNKYTSPETSPEPPALCVHNGNLYIAWKGNGNDNLNVARVDQPGAPIVGFVSKVTLGDTSPKSPSLASLNGVLYLAWKGDGNDQLNVMSSTDNGQTFGNKFTSNETSPQAPCIAAHNGNLYISWKGDGNDNLNVAQIDVEGNVVTGFSNKVTLDETSPQSPSIASFGGNLYISWKGDGNDFLNIMYSTNDGATFGDKYISGETSPQAPCIAGHAEHLYISWKGDGNDYQNVSPVIMNGGTIVSFSSPYYIYQSNISNFPVKPGDQIYCLITYVPGQAAGQITMANDTNGANFAMTIVAPPGADMLGNCVEWIMEAPDYGYPISALPAFTPVEFTSAAGCGRPPEAGIGNPATGYTDDILYNGKQYTSTVLAANDVKITFQG